MTTTPHSVATLPRLGGALRPLLDPSAHDPLRRALPAALAGRLDGRELVAIERLIALLPPSPPLEREAFALALVALHLAIAEGSSGVTLHGPPSWRGYREQAGLLLGVSPTSREVDELTAAFGQVLLRQRALPSAARLVTEDGHDRPLVLDDGVLALHAHVAAEGRIAARLAALLEDTSAVFAEDAIEAAAISVLTDHPLRREGTPLRLAAAQVHAVLSAPRQRLLVLSGGPGTGKTSVVASMLRMFAALGIPPREMVLTAPTGRAAHRLTETLGEALRSVAVPLPTDERLRHELAGGQTLHRLLGYSRHSRRLRYDSTCRLPMRVLVVDEVSMVDLELMAGLLEALPGEGMPPCHLLLVGDAAQLPAVGTGDVLRQLTLAAPALWQGTRATLRSHAASLAARLTPAAPHEDVSAYLEALPDDDIDPLRSAYVHLTHTFRQRDDEGGRQIRTLARRVLDGAPGSLFVAADGVARVESFAQLTFQGAAHCAGRLSSPAGRAFLHTLAQSRVYDDELREAARGGLEPDDPRLAALVRQSAGFRLLCLTHHGDAGEEFLNREWLAHFSSRRDDAARDTPGCPVLVLENDASSGLYNGDQGVIARVRHGTGTRLEAVFPTETGVRRVPTAVLPRVAPCFAMTVHKSQGSEYNHVLLALPPPGTRLLTRQLVYTAVTRARQSVTLLGPEESLLHAARTPTERASRLRARVQRQLGSAAPPLPR